MRYIKAFVYCNEILLGPCYSKLSLYCLRNHEKIFLCTNLISDMHGGARGSFTKFRLKMPRDFDTIQDHDPTGGSGTEVGYFL